MQLTLKGIQKKQDWNAANIALPSYSIEEIRKKTREKFKPHCKHVFYRFSILFHQNVHTRVAGLLSEEWKKTNMIKVVARNNKE